MGNFGVKCTYGSLRAVIEFRANSSHDGLSGSVTYHANPGLCVRLKAPGS